MWTPPTFLLYILSLLVDWRLRDIRLGLGLGVFLPKRKDLVIIMHKLSSTINSRLTLNFPIGPAVGVGRGDKTLLMLELVQLRSAAIGDRFVFFLADQVGAKFCAASSHGGDVFVLGILLWK